jgi:DNA polymerase-3 subunit alpha
MPKFKYSCGCEFDVVDQKNNSIIFDTNIDNINFNCSKAWDIISSGNTKGVFQLESRLGRSIAKKLKPRNMEELAALISILRPGCLEATREGKSVTNHYIDRKNNLESIDYFHPALRPMLSTTLGELIYQEQCMEIAKEIAGFDLQQADELRKAIGKKLADKMAKVKTQFLEGSKAKGIVSTTEAEEIFGWIEKSQRYSFNKSHAVSYAINAYLSAYAKAHFPKIFFAAYLRFARDKINPQDEIKALIQNANEMDIAVLTPDIRIMNKYFVLNSNKIYFGLTDIKGVGDSVFLKIEKILGDNENLLHESWISILFKLLININSIAAKSLIQSGAFSFLNKTRTSMIFEYDIASKFTKKEVSFLLENYHNSDTLKKCIEKLLLYSKINKNRIIIIQNFLGILKNPPYSLEDSCEWIAETENHLLGCSITCSKIDVYDISMTNITCRDFKNNSLEKQKKLILAGEVSYANVTKTKTGKNKGLNMAFVTLSDQTGSVDSVIFFPEQYKEYSSLIFEGNIIVVLGYRAKTGDSFVVEKAYRART